MVRSEPDKVRDFAKQVLNDMLGEATFRVYRYPEEDRDVADEARLSLVVLDLDQGATEEGMAADTEKFVTQVLKQHGKGFRKHANMLIFLAPDQGPVLRSDRRRPPPAGAAQHRPGQGHQAPTDRRTTQRPGGTLEGGRGPAACGAGNRLPLRPGASEKQDAAHFRP